MRSLAWSFVTLPRRVLAEVEEGRRRKVGELTENSRHQFFILLLPTGQILSSSRLSNSLTSIEIIGGADFITEVAVLVTGVAVFVTGVSLFVRGLSSFLLGLSSLLLGLLLLLLGSLLLASLLLLLGSLS